MSLGRVGRILAHHRPACEALSGRRTGRPEGSHPSPRAPGAPEPATEPRSTDTEALSRPRIDAETPAKGAGSADSGISENELHAPDLSPMGNTAAPFDAGQDPDGRPPFACSRPYGNRGSRRVRQPNDGPAPAQRVAVRVPSDARRQRPPPQ